MIPHRALTGVVLLAAAATLGAQTIPPPQPTQVFRAGTDVVVVDVAVREGGRAVTGLRAEDFVLTDNGVRQRIDSVEPTAVPIDVTLVVDVSGSPMGGWTTPPSPARVTEQIRAEVARVAAVLRPEDRIRTLAVDGEVQHVLPLQPGTAPITLQPVTAGGLARTFDALTAALLQPVEPARRHVVVARTKGIDTMSATTAATVAAVAEGSDALLHVVLSQTAQTNETILAGFQCAMMGLCWPSRSFWRPHMRTMFTRGPGGLGIKILPDGQAIADGATATGGRLHQAEMITEPSLEGTFKKAFEDFRSSYVLRYTLQGVPQGGWHTIEVTVPGKRNYTVRSRRGYLVEAPEPLRPEPPLPAQLRSLPDFTTAYERGAYNQVASSLRRMPDPTDLLRDFQDAGNPWPGNPRREATLILELVEPAVFSSRRETREAGFKAIDRFRRLIRHPLEPDVFERYWYFALLAMLEGTLRPAVSEVYLALALERFPDEPRFVLSRAILMDQRLISTAGVGGVRPSAEQINQIRRHYASAIALPGTAVEARIRFAWFLHRAGLYDEALTHLTAAAAQPIGDVSLRYLHQLFQGHVLWSLGKREESIAAYRDAVRVLPAAQSGRVALMNALMLAGERAEAEQLAQQVQTETSADLDPWWMYWQGQYRLYPQVMARVREMSQ